MFKYMRYASGVWRIGLETNAKDVVLILPRYVQVVCASLVMLEMQRRELELRHMLCPLQGKAMQLAARLW